MTYRIPPAVETIVSIRERILGLAVKGWFFGLVRPPVVADLDTNEDFACIVCGEPVLRRTLMCDRCAEPGRR